MWNYLTPELPVADVSEAQAWYRDVLDFLVTRPGGTYGAVQLGHVELYLVEAPEPRPQITLCIRVDNADDVYALFVERGVQIMEKIDTKPWRMREFSFRDPNGHTFRVGHSTRA